MDVKVAVGEGVSVGVGVSVKVGVGVSVGVGVFVEVGVKVAVGVNVAVGLGVSVGLLINARMPGSAGAEFGERKNASAGEAFPGQNNQVTEIQIASKKSINNDERYLARGLREGAPVRETELFTDTTGNFCFPGWALAPDSACSCRHALHRPVHPLARPLAAWVDLQRPFKIIHAGSRTGKRSQVKPWFFKIRIQCDRLLSPAARGLAVAALQGLPGVL